MGITIRKLTAYTAAIATLTLIDIKNVNAAATLDIKAL